MQWVEHHDLPCFQLPFWPDHTENPSGQICAATSGAFAALEYQQITSQLPKWSRWWLDKTTNWINFSKSIWIRKTWPNVNGRLSEFLGLTLYCAGPGLSTDDAGHRHAISCDDTRLDQCHQCLEKIEGRSRIPFISVYHHLPWGVIRFLLGKGLCHHPWVLGGFQRWWVPSQAILGDKGWEMAMAEQPFPHINQKNDPAFISKNLKNKKNTLY